MPTTPFFEQVYAVVRRIPKGKVTSYGRVAAMLGSPRAARAVGYAMNGLRYKSEEYDDVPWQRVINHAGYISIKGSANSKHKQAELLRAEGVAVDDDFNVDLEKYLWEGLELPEINDIIKGKFS
ncbi:MAG: cysteine methyltransferase [Chloroflexi bacterium]|nr:MAG: cysteine methyltransferase [Chloroflexota bacterium]MBL1196697.1 cysteine methyltransferase [Chloroflexota bacterium]NOH13990.1 cysteine methyltransferase [Chloroflexota bacterium]